MTLFKNYFTTFKYFPITNFFIVNTKNSLRPPYKPGNIPLITCKEKNFGIYTYISGTPTVNYGFTCTRNGQPGIIRYRPYPFCCNSDVFILNIQNKNLKNPYIL